MVIGSGPNVSSVWPFADALVKFTVPKLASGSTPPRLDGASAITSADESEALFSRCVVTCVHCCVASLIVRVNLPPPPTTTDALILSPGTTGFEKFTGNFGYISYQA